jgi:hypothetical protein
MLCMMVNLERYSPPPDCASSDKQRRKTVLLSKMFPRHLDRWRHALAGGSFASILDSCRPPSKLMRLRLALRSDRCSKAFPSTVSLQSRQT